MQASPCLCLPTHSPILYAAWLLCAAVVKVLELADPYISKGQTQYIKAHDLLVVSHSCCCLTAAWGAAST